MHLFAKTHICVGKLTTIGSANGLSPGRRQAIIWSNAGILFIGPLGTNFIEILIRIHTFSFKSMLLKMASAKWRPFCLGLNVLTQYTMLPTMCIWIYFQVHISKHRGNKSKLSTVQGSHDLNARNKCKGFILISKATNTENIIWHT